MSELDLLVDCLKDAAKEQDELAGALEQRQNVIDAAQRLSWEVGHHEIGTCMCAKCDLHLQLKKLTESAGDTLPIRDAGCLDSGCNEGEAHKPWCDHAQTVPDQGNDDG